MPPLFSTRLISLFFLRKLHFPFKFKKKLPDLESKKNNVTQFLIENRFKKSTGMDSVLVSHVNRFSSLKISTARDAPSTFVPH